VQSKARLRLFRRKARAAIRAKLLTKDEATRIAVNFAKLPELFAQIIKPDEKLHSSFAVENEL
jgi:hypothetical protein